MEDDEVHNKPSDPEVILYNPNALVTGTSQLSDGGNRETATKDEGLSKNSPKFAKDMARHVWSAAVMEHTRFIKESITS